MTGRMSKSEKNKRFRIFAALCFSFFVSWLLLSFACHNAARGERAETEAALLAIKGVVTFNTKKLHAADHYESLTKKRGVHAALSGPYHWYCFTRATGRNFFDLVPD